ncbi:proteasome subunit beta type-3-like [Drosophila obscura]|uniref:proteasome subunit beta type-3-like n=1 Tax=Drosophila obscura TaxID=7282 RepID=UPI001BB28181|nr:proteasome subunit beta type-3-like [Drosophila obscura]
MSAIISGSAVALSGKHCVAIATDHPIAGSNFDHGNMFKVAPLIYVALSGPQQDVVRVRDRMKLRQNMFGMVTPEIYAKNLSNYLSEPRLQPYHVESVVAGLHSETVLPFICSLNESGLLLDADDFTTGGKCPGIGAICKSLWKPNMGPADLVAVLSDAILNGSNLIGTRSWGVTIYVLHKLSEHVILMPKN